MGEEDSDEENGVEIVIPTKEDDTQIFADTASEIFQFFKVRPIIKGAQVKFDDRNSIYDEEKWTWRGNDPDAGSYHYHRRNGSGDAIALMGNIGYPIDWSSLNICSNILNIEVSIMTYAEPTNLTTIGSLLDYTNVAVDGYLGVGLIIALYFIVLINLKMRGELTQDAMLISGWITIIPSMILVGLGLLNNIQFFFVLAILLLSVIWSYSSRE